MIPEMEDKVMGLEPIDCEGHSWDTFFYKRANNSLDISWYDLCFNYNSFPYNTNTCIVLTSYYNHLMWLKASLTSYRRTGKYVVVGYDNPIKFYDRPWPDERRLFPRGDHFLLAHSFVFKHPTFDNKKRFGSYWDVKYAQGIVNMFNFKYVLMGTTDCVFERPEGLDELIEIMGDGDLMACASTSTPVATGALHSNSVLFTIDAFNKYMEYTTNHFKVPLIGHGCKNLDTTLREAVIAYKLKETIAPEQPIYPKDGSIDMYSCYGQSSTWKNVLGFHNLFAEYITASEEKLEPPDRQFVDDWNDYFYMDPATKNTIGQYYKTGDRRYLYQWWDVFSFKPKHLPLDSYGKEPIYS